MTRIDRLRQKKLKMQAAQQLRLAPTAPKPPIIESWRTAGGFKINREGPATPTPFLGIARVPAWLDVNFTTALRGLLDPLEGTQEYVNNVQDVGGEFYSEITVCFKDEEAAARALEKINGVLCYGRLLQVSFAPDCWSS